MDNVWANTVDGIFIVCAIPKGPALVVSITVTLVVASPMVVTGVVIHFHWAPVNWAVSIDRIVPLKALIDWPAVSSVVTVVVLITMVPMVGASLVVDLGILDSSLRLLDKLLSFLASLLKLLLVLEGLHGGLALGWHFSFGALWALLEESWGWHVIWSCSLAF